MTQTKLSTKPVAQIGEEIGLELGNALIKSYQQSNPNDTHAYVIGRDIIDQILSQPGCVGIKFFNAINEAGEKTLVYVGLDSSENTITKISYVEKNGQLISEAAIVADRSNRPGQNPTRIDDDGFEWFTID